MTDISELKQKEQELARSRQEYTTIVEMANSIIAEIDTEGRITFINQTGLETLGFSREELIGKPALGTFIPEQESTGRDLSTLLTDIIQNHRSHIITEHENLRSDGSRMWIHWQNRAMTDSKGRVTGILGVGQDITERKKAEEVLQRDKQTLESLVQERTTKLMAAQQELERSRRLADLGRLSSSIAHELRRPLAAIKLSLYNIRKKRKNDAIDTHLDHCEGKIAEGEQIINNILHSSSLKQPQVEEIDLATLLIECIEYAESHYIDKTTTIHRKLEPLRSTKVEADPHQMREVMLNILQNACEAVFDEPANIAVQGFAREDTIGFSVSDTNDGIPEGELAKVTEPFYSTKHRGMGLGLTIAQEIVTLHNGTLEVDSSPGAGTTVTVTLPKSTGY
jgi:PAS domain S-box-containing protein